MKKRETLIEISIVMPALNEEQSIGLCIKKAKETLESHRIKNYEIIVADNGSTDRTREIAKKLGAKVVIEKKKGYGNAYMKGISSSKGKYIVIGDSDDSYDWRDVMRFINPLKNEKYDVVMGTRFKKPAKILPGAMSWHHKYIGNPILSGILNLFFKTGISDAHCGMRSFTSKAYKKMDLKSPGMEFASEFVIKAARLGLRIKEIPIILYPDARGGKKSHLRSFSDGWRHLRLMLLYSSTWLFFIPGIAFILLGALIFALVQLNVRILGHSLHFHFSILGTFIIIMGIQVLTLGVYAKLYSFKEGIDIEDKFIKKFLKFFKVDKGIITGIIFAIIGFAINLSIFIEWVLKQFGALYRINIALLGGTILVIGLQIIFGSFFIGLLQIGEEKSK